MTPFIAYDSVGNAYAVDTDGAVYDTSGARTAATVQPDMRVMYNGTVLGYINAQAIWSPIPANGIISDPYSPTLTQNLTGYLTKYKWWILGGLYLLRRR